MTDRTEPADGLSTSEGKLFGTIKALLTFGPVLLLLGTSVGCLIKEDSPAPGCIEYWGPAPTGGCFGKSVVMDLTVEPLIECLSIEANNCNGGILEVSNACDEVFVLGGMDVGPGEQNVGLDVVGEEDGSHVLSRTASNFSNYLPEENEAIELMGALGDREVRVSFTKTKALCD